MDWATKKWNNNNKGPKISEIVGVLDLTKRSGWTTFRAVDKNPIPVAHHWLSVMTKEGKIVQFPKVCHGLEVDQDGEPHINADKCAYCRNTNNYPSIEYYLNGIDRAEQEREPRDRGKPSRAEKKPFVFFGNKAFYMEGLQVSRLWTPIRMLRITKTIGEKITELAQLNTVKVDGEKRTFGPQDPKYGFDLMIRYNKDAEAASAAYSVQKGERTRLDSEEIRYHRWKLDYKPTESEEEAERESMRMRSRLVTRKGEPIFPDEFDPDGKGGKGKGKGPGKKAKSNKYRDEFDEDDEDEVYSGDDDDEEERPRRGKKTRSKSRSRDDDYDDDEDDTPPRRRRSRDDEDDDEYDAPRRRGSHADDDDEEDDTPRRRRRSRSRDDDEDDEEERPRRSKGKKKSRGGTYEDEFDDEIPF